MSEDGDRVKGVNSVAVNVLAIKAADNNSDNKSDKSNDSDKEEEANEQIQDIRQTHLAFLLAWIPFIREVD